ncbi:hypothetical protein [Leucobacter massiliensis]|uniref:Bacteriocin biosynthesis cyclodehydratase domain-containing protein n=1 Tax=Leucobacter massiliensis TaxID=1686285 RepID=A0A2S9QMQ3_9MICO|nr:hypothetical protein [Leucobacter massiliensis]PRI10872.1 hypothetical protein B4915_08260 [Leucobacter massiliensis]
MSAHLTRIDPDLPLCWEDPYTLRVGFERAHTRLVDPTAREQRLLARLLRGIERPRLGEAVRALGVSRGDAQRLFQQLREVLVSEPPPRPRPLSRRLNAVLSDDGREVPGLRDALLGTGLCGLDGHAPHELAIHVERFLEPLGRAQRWLIAGVPHLLVRFTDGAVHVGPLVGPRGSPCHSCVTLALLRRDPAYPVLASQLAGRTPSSESGAAAHMVAAFAGQLLRAWQAGDDTAHIIRYVIPVRRGLVSGAPLVDVVAPHQECACTLPDDGTSPAAAAARPAGAPSLRAAGRPR